MAFKKRRKTSKTLVQEKIPQVAPKTRTEMKPPYYIVVGSKKGTLYPFDSDIETVHGARRCKHLETAIRFRSKVLEEKKDFAESEVKVLLVSKSQKEALETLQSGKVKKANLHFYC